VINSYSDYTLVELQKERAHLLARRNGEAFEATGGSGPNFKRFPMTPDQIEAAFAPLMERARVLRTRRDSDAVMHLENARMAALDRAALQAEYAEQRARADQHRPEPGDDPDDLWHQVEIATRIMQDQLQLARYVGGGES